MPPFIIIIISCACSTIYYHRDLENTMQQFIIIVIFRACSIIYYLENIMPQFIIIVIFWACSGDKIICIMERNHHYWFIMALKEYMYITIYKKNRFSLYCSSIIYYHYDLGKNIPSYIITFYLTNMFCIHFITMVYTN